MLRKLLRAALVCALTMSFAWAHITLEQKSAATGSSYKAVFRVPHGCDGSATNAITVFIPASVHSPKPVAKNGWAMDVKPEKLTQTTQISWSGGLLPDKQNNEFVVQMTLPDMPGKLYFRVLQSCEKGQIDWAGIPVEGAEKSKSPAPMLEVVRAYAIGKIRITHPWARATVAAQATGGAYLTLENGGGADRLLSVSSSVAETAELHSMTMDGNVMKMRKLTELEIPAGKTTELNPGSFHIMLTTLKAPLKQGDVFPLKLKFEKSGEITVDVQVEAITSNGASTSDEHEHMH